jgi:hypothetical protein
MWETGENGLFASLETDVALHNDFVTREDDNRDETHVCPKVMVEGV